MKGFIKELNDSHNNVIAAVITIIPNSIKKLDIENARKKLVVALDEYVGSKGHNTYFHKESDTVAAVVTFDYQHAQGRTIEIV